MARRRPTIDPVPVADERLLARRARWLEARLACMTIDELAETDRAVVAARRASKVSAAIADPAERFTFAEAAAVEMFGCETVDALLRSHDRYVERWG